VTLVKYGGLVIHAGGLSPDDFTMMAGPAVPSWLHHFTMMLGHQHHFTSTKAHQASSRDESTEYFDGS